MNLLSIADLFTVFILSPLLVSLLTFSVGYILVRVLKIHISKNFATVIPWLIGLVLVNFSTSVVVTSGYTIQLCFLPILLFLLFYNRSQKNEIIIASNYWKSILTIAILNLLWSCFYFLCFRQFLLDADVEQALYHDIYFYVRVSESIWQSGFENALCGLNLSPTFTGGTLPYHYFELYQNMIQSKLFGINSLWAFIISVPIVFVAAASSLITSVIHSVAEHKNEFILFTLGIAFLFISGFNVLPFSYIEKNAFSVNIMNHVTPKYVLIFIFVILISYSVFRRKYVYAIVLLSMIPVFTFLMMPVVLWTVFIGSGLLRISKEINNKELVLGVLIAVISTAFIMGFYSFTSVSDEYKILAINYGDVFEGLVSNFFYTIKRIIGTHIYFALDYLIYLLPAAIALFLYREKIQLHTSYIRVIIFFIVLFEGAMISTWLLFDYYEQAWQPQYYSLCLGGAVLIIWCYLWINNIQKVYSFWLLGLIILVCGLNIKESVSQYYIYNDKRFEKYDVSRVFFEQVNELFANKGNITIGFLDKQPEKPTVYPVGNLLLHTNTKINLECLDPSIINSEDNITQYRVTSLSEYRENHQDLVSIEKLQVEFIEANNIEYIIGYDSLPQSSALVNRSTLMFKDKMSGLYIRKFRIE